MYKKIYNTISKYDKIVITRHIGVDPDALASQLALRDSIKETFPNKKVYAIGMGSYKLNYMGKLDNKEDFSDALLIVTDTPDKRRVDLLDIDFTIFKYSIKIDHHPFIEKFCNIECIEDEASSASEIIMKIIEETDLKCTKKIAETLFMGLVADSNRFLFDSCTSKTFDLVSTYIKKYKFSINEQYQKMYLRDLSEVRMEGFMKENMILTDNGVGYITITDDIINKYKVDAATSGNLINNFNFIKEILVWVTITEDLKNEQIRVSIRSRGPEVNRVAEKYHGGGHKFASGAHLSTIAEAICLVEDLDITCKKYIKENL